MSLLLIATMLVKTHFFETPWHGSRSEVNNDRRPLVSISTLTVIQDDSC